MVYPGHVYDLLDSNIRIPGSKLQELFMENRGDAANFVYEVNEILAGIKPAVEFLEAVWQQKRRVKRPFSFFLLYSTHQYSRLYLGS